LGVGDLFEKPPADLARRVGQFAPPLLIALIAVLKPDGAAATTPAAAFASVTARPSGVPSE
jgi:hypothetical protein